MGCAMPEMTRQKQIKHSKPRALCSMCYMPMSQVVSFDPNEMHSIFDPGQFLMARKVPKAWEYSPVWAASAKPPGGVAHV